MPGPPTPTAPYKGTRFDPVGSWMFAKGIYGPPDNRPFGFHRSVEQAIAWGLAKRFSDGTVYRTQNWVPAFLK